MKTLIPLFLIFFILIPAFAQNNINNADGDAIQQESNNWSADVPLLPNRSSSLTLPAGDAIEGDYIGQMTFTTDGEKVLVPHRVTNNISVFDWNSREIIQDIPVGEQPLEVVVTDDYALVPCYSSDELYIINLDDYSVAAIIPTAAQPSTVRVSRTGMVAAVACDEEDVLEIINLTDLTKTSSIPNFETYLYKFSFITSNPRNTLYWNGFEMSPDGSMVIGGTENGLRFFSTANGSLIDELSEVTNVGQMGLSGDGQRLVTVNSGNSSEVSLIGLDSIRLITKITVDQLVPSFYSSVAVNFDGSRAFVPGGSNSALLVRFDQGDLQTINTTSSPNWVGQSADYQYAVSGQYYLNLIDFNTGAILALAQGRPIQNGVVSPQGNRLVACDPLRYEGLYFYDFENTSNLSFLGQAATGSELEADVAYSASFSPDGKKLLVPNSLSGTMSIIDVEAESLEAILPFSSAETYHTAITSDSRYAIMAKRLENQVDIIDLNSGAIIKTVASGGSKPDQVAILPGDEEAYIFNAGGTDAIGVIQLDGTNSQLSSSFPSGNTGISWSNYGIRSDFKITGDGAFGVLATPFSDAVKIIRLSDHSIVADIELTGFPLQIAISKETALGYLAAVTLKNDHAIAIIGNIGANAALLGTYPCGQNPTRIAYNPLAHQFAVCSNDDQTIEYFDPENLVFIQSQSVGPDYTPIAIEFDEMGNSYQLLRSGESSLAHLLRINEEDFELPALPIHHFDVSPDGRLAAVTMPGSDEVFLVKRDPTTGIRNIRISLSVNNQYKVSPNPSDSDIQFERIANKPFESSTIDLRLYDSQGKIVYAQDGLSPNYFSVSRQKLTKGLLLYQIKSGHQIVGMGQVMIE